eukprot:s957_g5.t3
MRGERRPGFRHAALQGAAAASCTKETAAASMNFYMYRAQSDVSYPPENCDLASAAGGDCHDAGAVVAWVGIAPAMSMTNSAAACFVD